jgi:hypothetical protein
LSFLSYSGIEWKPAILIMYARLSIMFMESLRKIAKG